MLVAAYVELLWKPEAGFGRSAPTVKQHLAAIRMLFDWLVTGQAIPTNPAHLVRGPKHVVSRGKTPVLTDDEARKLLDSIKLVLKDGTPDLATDQGPLVVLCLPVAFDLLKQQPVADYQHIYSLFPSAKK